MSLGTDHLAGRHISGVVSGCVLCRAITDRDYFRALARRLAEACEDATGFLVVEGLCSPTVAGRREAVRRELLDALAEAKKATLL